MIQIITQPAAEPITLAEAKAYLQEDQDHNDAMITVLIIAARQLAEEFLFRKLISQKVKEYRSTLEKEMTLCFPNVSSLESIKYLTDDDTESADIKTNFALINVSEPAELVAKNNYSLPSPYNRKDTIRIEYNTGFATASAVPAPIKQAMLLMIGKWYENREDEEFISRTSSLRMTSASKMLLQPYRIWQF